MIATAVSLAGCGGDLVVSEGDTTINEGDTVTNVVEGGDDTSDETSSR
ncbi:hypothetical protein ACOBV9_21445 (plasmid) [Pseudoalteromonas espejiana]